MAHTCVRLCILLAMISNILLAMISKLFTLANFLISFRLSEDGNQVTLIQRDGTNSPTLIFLDDGPQGFINKLEE